MQVWLHRGRPRHDVQVVFRAGSFRPLPDRVGIFLSYVKQLASVLPLPWLRLWPIDRRESREIQKKYVSKCIASLFPPPCLLFTVRHDFDFEASTSVGGLLSSVSIQA